MTFEKCWKINNKDVEKLIFKIHVHWRAEVAMSQWLTWSTAEISGPGRHNMIMMGHLGHGTMSVYLWPIDNAYSENCSGTFHWYRRLRSNIGQRYTGRIVVLSGSGNFVLLMVAEFCLIACTRVCALYLCWIDANQEYNVVLTRFSLRTE